MTKLLKLLCAAAVGLGVTSTRASADVISGSSQSGFAGGSVTSASFSNPFTAPAGTGFDAGRQVSLNVNATKMNTAIDETFALLGNFSPANSVRDYFFTVNVTNSVSPVYPIGPFHFDLIPAQSSSAPIGGANGVHFVFGNGTPSNPSPQSTYNSFNNFDPGASSDTRLWFGGLSGGGGQFATGSTQTFSFLVELPNTGLNSSNFTLRMVANPEPASLALAGIALAAFGAARWRRFRKSAMAVDPPA